MREPFDERPRVRKESVEAAIKKQEERDEQAKKEQKKREETTLLKKIVNGLVDCWYRILLFLALGGVFVILPIALWLIFDWEGFLELLACLKGIGNGSAILGLIYLLLGAIAGFNMGIAFLAMIEKILKELKPKWMYVYIIVTALGVVAIGILMENKTI